MMGGRLREWPFRPLCTNCVKDIPKKSNTVVSGEVGKDQGGVLAQRWSRMEADDIESRVGAGRLKERGGLGRRTGWSFGGQAQMREDLDHHGRIFDGRDAG